MTRFARMWLVAIVACPVLAVGVAPAADPPGKGPDELQGCWKLVAIETDGKSSDPVGGGQPRWVVKGDTVAYGGDEILRFVADPATTPRVIDLKFRDPER